MITEAQARFVLRRMGYRLSQRNDGYTILDADQHYASGLAHDGQPLELTLQQVADWTATASSADQRNDSSGASEDEPASGAADPH